ncbi:hypothetical protein [Methylotuvimicrobium sp. KM2]|uniref:hypothetical protein n=1 Tax=Methylotuvimicrobium sp. KM2 TaxID=3133976 RepID=UPI003101221A
MILILKTELGSCLTQYFASFSMSNYSYALKIGRQHNMAKHPLQQISIIQELELSIETIKSALSIIQKIEHQKTPSFLIFLLLSTGIERLFKIIIGMRLLSDGKQFPTEEELKRKYGHDLSKLKRKLLALCVAKPPSVPVSKEDKDFLENDVVLNELLAHLSEFALKDRYVYMNRIANEESTGKWLSHRWDEIESKIVPQKQAIEMILNNKQNEYKSIIALQLVITVERLLGAVCRMVTLGKMDGDSNSAATLLYDFLFLKESDLGKRNYDLFGYSPI